MDRRAGANQGDVVLRGHGYQLIGSPLAATDRMVKGYG
jgi:hypothetical protein